MKEKMMLCRFTEGVCNVQPQAGRASSRSYFKGILGFLAFASVLVVSTVFAKEPVESELKPTGKGTGSCGHAQHEAAAIPECLEHLNLTSQQQTRVKEIVQDYDASLGMVWQQFGARYMEAIAMESSLLAAIEDNLTEAQRQQVREQRRKSAQHEKAISTTYEKSNQATDKASSAVDNVLEGVGITLTTEQATTADKVQDKYRTRLRSLNRDIEGLHNRLVSLEADKLVEIEKVLTKEQLAQLRQNRQSAPQTPNAAVSKTEPRKTE